MYHCGYNKRQKRQPLIYTASVIAFGGYSATTIGYGESESLYCQIDRFLQQFERRADCQCSSRQRVLEDSLLIVAKGYYFARDSAAVTSVDDAFEAAVLFQ